MTVSAQSVIPLSGFQNLLPLYNPASAGINKGIELALIHKSQWKGFPEAPKLTALTINMPFNYDRFGAGLILLKESAGIQNTVSINGLFSYKINFAKGRLSFGAKAGIVQWNQDFSGLTIKDESETIIGTKKTIADLAIGFLYKDNKNSLGFSINYSPGIYLGLTKIGKIYYTISGERKQKINSSICIYPAYMIRYTEKFSTMATFSIPLEYKKLVWAGFSYRSSATLSFMGGLNLHTLLNDHHNSIGLFYYFDYHASAVNLGNSHELLLSFSPGRQSSIENIKRKRATVSPLLFE